MLSVRTVPLFKAKGGEQGLARSVLRLHHAHEPLGVGERKRLKQRGVNRREHGAVGADAKRQREHDGRGEAGRPPQSTEREAKIPPHRLERWKTVLVAIGVLDLSESAHGSASGCTSLVWGQSLRAIFGLERLEVMGQLGVQVGIEPAPTKQVNEAPPHDSPPAGLARNFAISDTVCPQLSVSSAICLRPRGVSW